MAWYSDVFDIIFKDIDREQANKCKICEWKKHNADESSKSEKDD